jgi:2-methylisocitrate lyase-like PEP mutase family enzyme
MNATPTPGARLRAALGRPEDLAGRTSVPSVLGLASALQAQLAELCGGQIGFVGTALTVRNYLALPDTGVASSTECLQIGGVIARSVSFPVILDGDTGHGGPDAVRRLVAESIREGLAGLRLDDQPLESKLPTQSAGIEVVSREDAVLRYRTAVEARDAIDPSFVIMAQCFARGAVNATAGGGGEVEEAAERAALYAREAHVDWVQVEGLHDTGEVARVGRDVPGWFSATLKGAFLSERENLDLGLAAAWHTLVPVLALQSAAYEFLQDYNKRGIDAWTDYRAAHADSFAAIAKLGR